MDEASTVEKAGAGVEGLTLLLCENPLPPLDEAVAAARRELPRSNHYTEPYSASLRERDIYVKPLEDDRLGPGYMRVTTARPEDNRQVVAALEAVL